MSTAPTKYCFACAAVIDERAEICPKCGVRQPGPGSVIDSDYRHASSNKIAAGLCGILFGSLGIHKFILGMTKPGLIMLLVSVLSCGILAFPMHIIGLIEGIIYLTKSDEDFYQTYYVDKKQWF